MANTCRRNAAAKAPSHSPLPASTSPQPTRRSSRPHNIRAPIENKDGQASDDGLGAPPTKKAKWGTTRKQTAKPQVEKGAQPPPTWEPLPPREGRNEHPGLRGRVAAAPRRTSQQVAAEREALRKAAEEQVRHGEEAKRALAAMMIAEEQRDAEMEEESTRRLSAVIRARGQYHHGSDGESFDLGAADDGSSDNSPSEGESKQITVNLSSIAINSMTYFVG
jgi:hypothetical protein